MSFNAPPDRSVALIRSSSLPPRLSLPEKRTSSEKERVLSSRPLGSSRSLPPSVSEHIVQHSPIVDQEAQAPIVDKALCGSASRLSSVRPRRRLGLPRGWLRSGFSRAAILLAAVALMLVVSLPLGVVFLVFRAQRQPPRPNAKYGDRAEGLLLYGGVRDWDMDTKTLAVRFIPHYCYDPDFCVHIPYDVLFFKDMDALGIGGFNESTAVLTFRESIGDVADHGRFDQFIDLEVPESPRSGQLNVGGLESDAMYPFDWYEVRMLFGATMPDLNTTVPVIDASIFNFLATLWRYDVQTEHIHFNSHATKLNVHIRLSRTVVVKISAILILILNWVVTVGIVYMVIASTAGQRKPPEGFDIVALPFAALFALPQVRSVMPGDPPFGCLLDFIGIIPNLALIAVSGTILLAVRVHRAKFYSPHKIQPE